MGTVIERVTLAEGGWRSRHSSLRLAVTAARDCLRDARRAADDVDLLINAGIYRDRNLGEPALAAMIQQDIGANPEDPHENAHGTFSFDIANGSCGMLTALQIADGFLKAHAVQHALIVAGDADPGHGLSEDFPFAAAAAALLCHWTDDDSGLISMGWVNHPDGGEHFNATVGLVDRRNVLRFAATESAAEAFAETAAHAARQCLSASARTLEDIDLVIAAPAERRYRSALVRLLGVPEARFVFAEDETMHTASIAAAFDRAATRMRSGTNVLLLAAGAGLTAGAALYRPPVGVSAPQR